MGHFSGRVLIRMPSELHEKLAIRAHLNNVSLNQYVVYLIANSLTENNKQVEKLSILEQENEGYRMGQDYYTGKRANEVGRLIGRTVAEELEIQLEAGSNKGIYNKRTVVIKSARLNNSRVGITNKMLTDKVQDVILAKEITKGHFDLYITEVKKIEPHGNPTRSKGNSRGRVTNFNISKIMSEGTKIGSVDIEI